MGLSLNAANVKAEITRLDVILRNLNDKEKVSNVMLALKDFNASCDAERQKYDVAMQVHYDLLSKSLNNTMGW